jgi:hypothetical protein
LFYSETVVCPDVTGAFSYLQINFVRQNTRLSQREKHKTAQKPAFYVSVSVGYFFATKIEYIIYISEQ